MISVPKFKWIDQDVNYRIIYILLFMICMSWLYFSTMLVRFLWIFTMFLLLFFNFTLFCVWPWTNPFYMYMGLDATKPVCGVSDKASLLSYRDYLENWNFTCIKFTYGTFQKMNNKDADQTVRMCRLVCPFVVCEPWRQVFSRRGPYSRWLHVF